MPDPFTSPSPRDAALAWFVRMNSGEAGQEDDSRFQAWLAADPRHRREYEKLGRLWTELDALPDPRPSPGDAIRRGASRRRLLFGGAAAVAAAAAVPLVGISTGMAADFRTGTGERKTVTASDGTRLELDAGTAIVEDYSSTRRRLRLLEGRALFAVADDAARPFEIVCRDGVCHVATATSLAVHRRADDVLVAAEEGDVIVEMGGGSGAAMSAELRSGQYLVYAADRVGPVQPMTNDAAFAWRRGKLMFQDQSLGDVVADLNRYRDGRIVIADRSLAALRLDGVFDSGRPEAALQAIVSTLPVRAWRFTDFLIVLRHR